MTLTKCNFTPPMSSAVRRITADKAGCAARGMGVVPLLAKWLMAIAATMVLIWDRGLWLKSHLGRQTTARRLTGLRHLRCRPILRHHVGYSNPILLRRRTSRLRRGGFGPGAGSQRRRLLYCLVAARSKMVVGAGHEPALGGEVLAAERV
jgi:hypothetical protein